MGRFVLEEDKESDDFRQVLVDTKTGEQVGRDGGEPEDNRFCRDWAWVPKLLNKIVAEYEALTSGAEGVK